MEYEAKGRGGGRGSKFRLGYTLKNSINVCKFYTMYIFFLRYMKREISIRSKEVPKNNDSSFSRSTFQRRRESRDTTGRYRRPKGSAERTSVDIEDAHQSHRRFPVEHGLRLARLARAR